MSTYSRRTALLSKTFSSRSIRFFICGAQCHTSGNSSEVTSSSYTTCLPQRSLVRVKGQDSQKLLQGLVTSDVVELSLGQSVYSMLLNAQGRVLYDVLLYCHSDQDYAMECDSRVLEGVLKHLKMYALRSKVSIGQDSEASVWAVYPGQPVESVPAAVQLYVDPRVSAFGSRIIAPNRMTASEVLPNLTAISAEDYDRHRMLAGIAEGSDEIPVGACFPLEYNLDFCHGVSFDKGCYLGQELTARTHHTGVVRKRVMPVSWQQDQSSVTVPHGTKLFNTAGKNVGKIITHLGNVGLALLRVQEVCNGPLAVEDYHKLEVNASIPHWWPIN